MKAPFHSRDLASRNKKAGGEFLGEEQTASDTLNWEFCRLHGGSETVSEGAERRAKQVRSVLQDTGHLQGDGHCSATLRPPFGHPSAAPWPPKRLGEGSACQTQSFPFCFTNSREHFQNIFKHIYLFIHSPGRGGGRKPTILMRNYLTLSCRIRYCMTQRLFGSTYLKMSCQIKTAEKEKTRTDFRQVSPARIWGGWVELQLFSLCDILFFLTGAAGPLLLSAV